MYTLFLMCCLEIQQIYAVKCLFFFNLQIQAIIWLLAAWSKITLSTTVNCWCKAGILPAEWCRRLQPDRAAVAVAEATKIHVRTAGTAIPSGLLMF